MLAAPFFGKAAQLAWVSFLALVDEDFEYVCVCRQLRCHQAQRGCLRGLPVEFSSSDPTTGDDDGCAFLLDQNLDLDRDVLRPGTVRRTV